MNEHRITEVAEMALKIPFKADAVEIVVGRGDVQQNAARRIARALSEKCGMEVPVVEDAAYADWGIQPKRHAIFVGSLGDNRGIEHLYYRWLTFVDNSYPGRGGYVLTTLWDPWGAGLNALIAGAADPDGLDAVVRRLEAFIDGVEGSLPGVCEVVYGASCAEEKAAVERLATEGPSAEGWVYNYTGYGDLQFVPQAAWAYVRSGDPRIVRGFRKILLELAASPVLEAATNRVHFHAWKLTMMWPMVQTAPIFSEADRLKVDRFLFDMIASTEGFRNEGLIRMAKTELPRQNHQTLCALGVLFGSIYFDRHYKLAEASAWRELVDQFYRIGAYCSKQICDNNDHGWNQSIGDFATYALVTGNTDFFDNGMARLAAERAVGNCTSNGFAATCGDGNVSAYPHWFLALVSFYLRDSGLRFAVDNLAPELRSVGLALRRSGQCCDGGLKAAPPADQVGVRVFPLDRLYYDIPKNSPGAVALKAPSVPHKQSFDILTMRSGWEKTAQYLILDGTGGGSHSYEDANAILTLAQDNRFLLLSADQLYFTAPKYHNMVTVTRNGLGDELPSYCRLDGKADLPRFGFSATTLPDYVGTDWTRMLLWKKGDFFLVVDRIVARERATYSGTCRWFGLGRPVLLGGICVFHQSEWEGSRTNFVVQNLSGQACRTQEAFYGPSKSWKSGFDPKLGKLLRTDRTLLTELDQTQSETLEAGEELRFVNLLYARSGERVADRLDTQVNDSGWALIRTPDGPFAMCVPGGTPVQVGGLRATCEALAVWNGGVFAAACSALKVGGLSVQFSRPCGVQIDASGKIAVDAGEDLAVLWRVEGGQAGERELTGEGIREWEVGMLSIPDPETLFGESGRPKAVVAPSGPKVEAPPPAWQAQGSGRINAVHLAEGGDVVLAACEEGGLRAFALDGTPAWTYETGSPVNTVHSGVLRAGQPARIVLGCENEFVHAIDASTREAIWQYHVEYGHQYWPWWSWYNASVRRVWVEDLDGDGNGEVVVTSGNIRLRLLDADGHERWEYRTDHGLFLTYETCDLDGDGKKEIVGGCDFLSSGSRCRVIGVDGREMHAFPNAGWTSQVKDVLIADLDDDGELEVACAVSRQENLRVHSFAEKARRWGRCLGEVPAGLALLKGPGGKVLFAATEGSTAIGFGPTGEPLWTVDVAPGAVRVVRMGDAAAVVCADGRILQVRGGGEVETLGMLSGGVTAGTFAKGWLILGSADGTLSAFRVL